MFLCDVVTFILCRDIYYVSRHLNYLIAQATLIECRDIAYLMLPHSKGSVFSLASNVVAMLL